MDLRIADLQNMLSVSRKTLYRWIQAKKIPAYRISGQYRFRREEIEDWLGSARVAAEAGSSQRDSELAVRIGELLRKGGIHYRVEGGSPAEVIRAALQTMPLPPGVDAERLEAAILARERLMSTSLGHGIAVPHPREPVLARPEQERVALCFLETPVDFHAADGQPVSVLFLVLGSTLKTQLRILSAVAGLCREPQFVELLARQAPRSDILTYVDARQGGGQ